MSTQVVVAEEIFKARGIQVMDHKYGDIAFINTELVTPKTIEIFMRSLDDADFHEDGHGIFSVVFRDDGYPMTEKGVLNSWALSIDACSAMCNIQHCIELAVQDTQNPEHEHSEKASLHMAIWKNMIKGFFHESYHSHTAIVEPEGLRYDKAMQEEDEELAPEFARDQLFALAKVIDIEPDFTPEVRAMIDERLMAEIAAIEADEEATKKQKAWVWHQKYLLKNGGVFYAPPAEKGDDGLHLMTFKEYLHFFSEDPADDPAWAAETIGVVAKVTAAPLNETANGQTATAPAQTTPNQQLVYVDPEEDPDADIDYGQTPGFQGVNQMGGYTQPTSGFAQTATGGYVQPAINYAQQPVNNGYAQPVYGNQSQPVAPQTYGQTAPTQHQPINLPMEEARHAVWSLYQTLAHHIFTQCGYVLQQGTKGFNNPDAIKAHIPLQENQQLFVKGYVINTPTGLAKEASNGSVMGRMIDKNGQLPGFEVIMQLMDGTEVVRTLIPQNPWKQNQSGQYSKTALECQQTGCGICWIKDGATGKFCDIRVYNGIIQESINGQWVSRQ